MAEVRSSAGAPAASAFGGLGAPSPGTPLIVNTVNGDLWVLLGSTPTRVAGGNALRLKTSNQSKTNDTTLADDNTLVFPILANETWMGRIFIDVHAGLTTTGIKFTVTSPTGSTGNFHSTMATDATSGKVNFIDQTTTPGAVVTIAAADVPASVSLGNLQIAFYAVNGSTAGNIAFQWAQATSSGTALTLGSGSQLTAQRTST